MSDDNGHSNSLSANRLPHNLTESQKQLIDIANYKGSSDEEQEGSEQRESEAEDNDEEEDDETAFARINDPLNHQLSSKRRHSLKLVLKSEKNDIPCPWCPSIQIYDWIVIVFGMFELQFNFFEEHVGDLQHNKTFQNMNGQCKAKFTGEIKNCAMVCFSTAVQGYDNPMLGRGSGLTVLGNQKFYQRYEDDTWTEAYWNKTVINPVAKWMDEAFKSQAIMQLHSTISATRKAKKRNSKGTTVDVPFPAPTLSHTNSWFVADDLLNGKGGETSLAYFGKRFSLVTATCDSTTEITNPKFVFFITGLVLQRIGIVTHKWQLKTDDLLPEEVIIYNDNKKLAWTSKERVNRIINRYNLEKARKIEKWQIEKLQNAESAGTNSGDGNAL